MTEAHRNDYRDAIRRPVSPSFTTNLFAKLRLDRYATAASALGDMFVAWNVAGITAIRPAGDQPAFETWYGERIGRRCVAAVEDDAIVSSARAKLRGEDADVPIDLNSCTPFEQRVLRKAAEIGWGHARPYAWIAREIGAPDAARAVGNALGNNPVPLVIPCHRVVRADLSPGGYVFGGEAKQKLLESEGVDVAAVTHLVRRGVRFVGCADGTFCLPTCGDVATHLDEPGYRAFHTSEEACARGLVPCSQCRPTAA